jgi:hypothetical protein
MTYEEYTAKRDAIIHWHNLDEIDGDEYRRQMDMLVFEYYGDD